MTNEITISPRQVWFDQEMPLDRPKDRVLLVAVLLVKGNRVSRAKLTRWLWGGPEKLARAIDEAVSAVRAQLGLVGLGQKLVNKGWHVRASR